MKRALFALLLACSSEGADDAVRPFDGTSLSGWRLLEGDPSRNKWRVGIARLAPDPGKLEALPGEGELVNVEDAGSDIVTEARFGDVVLDVEVFVARGSNSGVYLMGNYEVQIKDSFGKTTREASDMGAIYGVSPPRANAARPYGEWQRLVVDFRAPRFEGGRKIANARFVRVTLNGIVVQEDVEVAAVTDDRRGPEAAEGPVLLQGDHGPVAYRGLALRRR